jgi:hypothetical protein
MLQYKMIDAYLTMDFYPLYGCFAIIYLQNIFSLYVKNIVTIMI